MAHLICAVFASFVLIGAKCIAYDERLSAATAQGDGTGDAATVSATPCTDPHEAIINVEEFAFIIRCGCAEPPGQYDEADRRCTVPVGTTVIWAFEGSQQHNVSSQAFEESRPRTSGRHAVTFDEPGLYSYACSLHIGQMNGYSILVQ